MNRTPEADQYFLRVRGKVMGPVPLKQLLALKERGRLLPDHEVSRDRKTWQRAGEIAELYPEQVSADPPGEAEVVEAAEVDFSFLSPEANTSSQESPEWYYTIDGEQDGPVTLKVVQTLAKKGRLKRTDLVWREGMQEWVPAESIDEFFTAAGPSGSSPSGKGAAAYEARESSRGYTIVWDAILDGVRSSTTPEGLDKSWRVMVQLGGISMSLTAVGILLVAVIRGMTLQSLGLLFGGLVLALSLSFLKFCAVHLTIASHNTIRATPSRISSQSVVNVLTMTWLMFFLTFVPILPVSLVTGALDASPTDTNLSPIAMLVMGLIWLVAVLLAAVSGLHARCMNMEISPATSSGEEGVSVILFFLKITSEFSGRLFGFGAAASTCAVGGAVVTVLLGAGWQDHSIQFMITAVLLAFMSGFFPLWTYLMLALGSIVLNTCQAIMTRSTP